MKRRGGNIVESRAACVKITKCRGKLLWYPPNVALVRVVRNSDVALDLLRARGKNEPVLRRLCGDESEIETGEEIEIEGIEIVGSVEREVDLDQKIDIDVNKLNKEKKEIEIVEREVDLDRKIDIDVNKLNKEKTQIMTLFFLFIYYL
jgi:hypothetical protein